MSCLLDSICGILILFRQVQDAADRLDNPGRGELSGLNFVQIGVVKIQPGPLPDLPDQPGLRPVQINQPLFQILLSSFTRLFRAPTVSTARRCAVDIYGFL